MLNQKKVEIFSRKFRKSLAKQFLEVAYRQWNIQAGATAARGGLLCFCLYFGTCRLLLFANFGASYIFMVFCYVFSVFALNIVFGYCFFPKYR